MRKISLFLLGIGSLLSANAQTPDLEKQAASKLILANLPALGLSDNDQDKFLVSASYEDPGTKIRYVYLQQSFKNIPVYNQIQALSFRDGKLLSVSGERIMAIEQKINTPSAVPAISASAAVITAMNDRKLGTTPVLINISSKNNGQEFEFGGMGISRENITAKLIWVPSDNNKTLSLAWQIYLVPMTGSDYWLVRIDAENNLPLGADNLTVYCNWDDPNHKIAHTHSFDQKEKVAIQGSPELPLADNGNYRVIAHPAEAPSFPGGAHIIKTNPWTAATPNATTLKWHSTAVGTDYNYTRGNNVWAYHDRNSQNFEDPARSATSTSALPNLNFDFTPDFGLEPIITSPPNQQFNITNLFYWNNIIHDVMYTYGFTEPAGNFQANNLGRGGTGSDYVMAEAQDGGGTNNANFSTPSDGGKGRMQMYLWTSPTPDRDGDVDNGIIVHEYGHGISNRLTGGPANSSCLGNAEQMGEGWSDYYALMLTQNWATSNLNTGFSSPRGIGTYALGQAPSGLGIRSQRYCTDFAVNNRVYATSISSAPHNRGEIWCATLWDMTWNIIQQEGVINPNIYDLAGGGGNNIALKLVTEGMKLQPCSPGFIDGRNAIIQADINLYGGIHVCAIKEAFRRRGMGEGASQGSSSSVTDQVTSFVGGGSVTLSLLQGGVSSTQEGQNINYTNRLVVGSCGDIANYKITDTLPPNVSFVSATGGGTYNPSDRVVSWTVNQAAGTTVDYNFVVTVNPGSYYPPVSLLDEQVTVTPPALPAGWATLSTPTTNLWSSTSAQSHTAPNSFFTSNLITANDQRLFTINNILLPASAPNLTFWSSINSEPSWDGGVVEISTDGGLNWSDLGSKMISGGYNGSLNASTNPLSGRAAFNGNSGGFIKTTVQLSAYAGQTVRFRFRFGSDESVAAVGWYVDDLLIQDIARVDMRSSLFNSVNVRLVTADASMLISQGPTCTAPSITNHPAGSSICTGANTSFAVVAAGDPTLTYQWQLSTAGAAGPWNSISNGAIYGGINTSTLTLTGVTAEMNGYRYRCVVSGPCEPPATSNSALLTVSLNSNAGSVSGLSPLCVGQTSTYTSNGDPAGTWSSSAPTIASVHAVTGLVTAINAGVTTITYTVSGCGGPSLASKTLTVNTCADYCMIGLQDINLGESNIVNGNIGNTGAGKKVGINRNSVVNGLIRASIITLRQPVTVTGGLFNVPADVALPPMLLNTAIVPAGSFSVANNAETTINTNYNTLTIGDNATVTINGTIYGTITIRQGATVTFTASDISINTLSTEDGRASPLKHTTILFSNDASVRIKNTVNIGDRNRVNESAPKRVTFYLGDQNVDNEQFNVDGVDTRINAGIYIPVGKLDINNNGPCIMTGTIIAQNIISSRNVTWNCGNGIPLTEPEITNEIYGTSDFTVKVYPNPSQAEFRILIDTKSTEPVKIRITDVAGRVLSSSQSNLIGSKLISVGNDLPAGIYYADVIQGINKKTVKLIKLK